MVIIHFWVEDEVNDEDTYYIHTYILDRLTSKSIVLNYLKVTPTPARTPACTQTLPRPSRPLYAFILKSKSGAGGAAGVQMDCKASFPDKTWDYADKVRPPVSVCRQPPPSCVRHFKIKLADDRRPPSVTQSSPLSFSMASGRACHTDVCAGTGWRSLFSHVRWSRAFRGSALKESTCWCRTCGTAADCTQPLSSMGGKPLLSLIGCLTTLATLGIRVIFTSPYREGRFWMLPLLFWRETAVTGVTRTIRGDFLSHYVQW